jgi:glutathione S-transferase
VAIFAWLDGAAHQSEHLFQLGRCREIWRFKFNRWSRSMTITLYHAPNSRSFGSLLLLEELGVPYTLHLLNLKAGEQRRPEYLQINPMGKVPALRDGDSLITEQVAIFIHLADRFPELGLAPAAGEPQRGPYLRWLVYYAACFEPAVVDRALKREPGPKAMQPYGDFETMLDTIANQIGSGPYLLGERFSAADILWATGLTWTRAFNLVPDMPGFQDYIARSAARPATARAKVKDAELAAAQGSA